jgi:hypothetical protein
MVNSAHHEASTPEASARVRPKETVWPCMHQLSTLRHVEVCVAVQHVHIVRPSSQRDFMLAYTQDDQHPAAMERTSQSASKM